MDRLAPLASGYAQVALANIACEFPNKPDHLLLGDADARLPRALHPVFYGSYDWHSSVHMHWTLVRLLRLYPQLPEAERIRAALDAHLTPDRVECECEYFRQPGRETFERPYGWAWLLKLQAELTLLGSTDEQARKWQSALQPLADVVVERFLQYLPRARYPVRAGTHGNSAFALHLALDYAQAQQHLSLRKQISVAANRWFGQDQRCPAAYEPGGEDFLSPGLVEAALMLRLVDGCSFADWWELFRPTQDGLAVWLQPVQVDDRTDARLSHLDGLNLSRVWCWRLLGPELASPLAAAVDRAIEAHLAASLPHVANGPYVGTHWLASFALLALSPVGQ